MKNTEKFSVRVASKDDIFDIVAIENICFSDPWSETAFSAQLNENCLFSLVCDGTRTVGYAVLALMLPESELYNIAVTPEYQGEGAANVLFESIESKAREKGVETVYLEVRESNLRARGFYRKKGFSEIGIRKNYYHEPTENAVLMSKNI